MKPIPARAEPPLLRRRSRLRWWQRLLLWMGFGLLGFVVLVVSLASFGYWAWTSGQMHRFFLEIGKEDAAKKSPQERPWPPAGQEPPDTWSGPRPDASQAGGPGELFDPLKVWEAHLRFTQRQWDAMKPEWIELTGNILLPGGKVLLRNPNASRNGLLGAMGLDLPWSACDLEFGGVRMTDVASRFKGNGTFVGSYHSFKKPYKLDLNRGAPGRLLARVETLNLHNLNADFSGMSDALGYEFFRAAGVPSPRTGYVRMLLTVEGQFNRRPLGLYVLVENPDDRWAREVFGVKGVGLFKPVTYELFKDLGDRWEAYEGIYDPKTKVTAAQKQRVIEASRFVTKTPDAQFAARVGEFFDLTEVARFVAGLSLISSYDGFLSNGQNFLMYLDPGSNRFGFIPWDLDHAWGEFVLVGSLAQLEQASVMRPWVGEHRLLERLFAVESFRALYRAELERMLNSLLVPERIAKRMDQLEAVIRPVVEEESDYRRSRFAQAMGSTNEVRAGDLSDPNRPVHQIKRFVVKRVESVREQLAGRSSGHEFLRRDIFGKEHK